MIALTVYAGARVRSNRASSPHYEKQPTDADFPATHPLGARQSIKIAHIINDMRSREFSYFYR
jgi:hypothetical protein